MSFKDKAVSLLRTAVAFTSRSERCWQQPIPLNQSSLFWARAEHFHTSTGCLPATAGSEQAFFQTACVCREFDAAGESTQHHESQRWERAARTVDVDHAVEGKSAPAGGHSTVNDELKKASGRVLVQREQESIVSQYRPPLSVGKSAQHDESQRWEGVAKSVDGYRAAERELALTNALKQASGRVLLQRKPERVASHHTPPLSGEDDVSSRAPSSESVVTGTSASVDNESSEMSAPSSDLTDAESSEEDVAPSQAPSPSPKSVMTCTSASGDDDSSQSSAPSSDSSVGGRPRRARGYVRRFCEHEGCTVIAANYGFPGGRPTRCKRHILEGMIIFQKGCDSPGCNAQAHFTFPDGRKGRRCAVHKEEGMVYRVQPVCKDHRCTRPALYGSKGEEYPSFCMDHKADDMIHIYYRPADRCQWEHGCMDKARYGDVISRVRRLCLKHKEPDMVHIDNCGCEIEGCTTVPSYGWPNQKGCLRCSKHKEDGMMLKRGHQCTAEGCSKHATFGYPGDASPSRCKTHKQDGMRNLTLAVCSAEGCERKAYYALPRNRASHCKKHKEPGMKNVVQKLCEVNECEVIASFRYLGDASPSRCKTHKEDGMRYLKYALCAAEGCKRDAHYGLPGSRASHCKEHKEPGMKTVVNKPCVVSECDDGASFGFPGKSRSHCNLHKEEGMTYHCKVLRQTGAREGR